MPSFRVTSSIGTYWANCSVLRWLNSRDIVTELAFLSLPIWLIGLRPASWMELNLYSEQIRFFPRYNYTGHPQPMQSLFEEHLIDETCPAVISTPTHPVPRLRLTPTISLYSTCEKAVTQWVPPDTVYNQLVVKGGMITLILLEGADQNWSKYCKTLWYAVFLQSSLAFLTGQTAYIYGLKPWHQKTGLGQTFKC